MYSILGLTLLSCVVGGLSSTRGAATTIYDDHPAIYYHGRWDKSPGTWWAGSGFKLHVKNLRNLTINLGEHTTAPYAAVGVSIDYQDFFTVNASVGANVIPLDSASTKKNAETVVRINVEGWQNNRINLETLTLNSAAELLPYKPSKLAFQFIGDSLSAVGQGQFLPLGVDQAWPFLVGEHFKAEHTIVAQPGAALKDIVSFGNQHGVSFQYFRTEDTGYYYTTDHNFTTPWDFSRDQTPTHIVIHIGTALGDKNIHLVDTTGWVTFDDVFPDNIHPDVPGHAKIAGLFESWLENWGSKAENKWATAV
ncbi:hypothetical protein DXG01_004124 [Tephrocybe rancida]|nr:hypothetical protein DXG01_004124 [Tephrocybe rancida]